MLGLDHTSLVKVSTSKFPSFLKVYISTICTLSLRQTRETCRKERKHLKTNKMIKV